MQIKFSKILKSYRVKHKLTHRALGKLSGVHYSMIHKYENGKATPTLKSAISLSKCLDFSLDVVE